MEQAQATQDRFASIRVSSDKNAYDEVLHHISERLEPDSNSRIGLNNARKIIEEGGSRFQGYLDSYANSQIQYMRMLQTNDFDNQYNKIQSGNVDYAEAKEAVDSHTTGNKVMHDRSKLQDQHFKNFNLDKEPLKKQLSERSATAQGAIDNQKMQTGVVGGNIKGKVNENTRPEHDKGDGGVLDD